MTFPEPLSLSIKLEQIPDFFKTIYQKRNIESIFPRTLTKDDYQNPNRKLSATEITELKGKIGRLNWIAGMVLFLRD